MAAGPAATASSLYADTAPWHDHRPTFRGSGPRYKISTCRLWHSSLSHTWIHIVQPTGHVRVCHFDSAGVFSSSLQNLSIDYTWRYWWWWWWCDSALTSQHHHTVLHQLDVWSIRKPSLEIAPTTLATFSPVTVDNEITLDFDLQAWLRWCQEEPSCQISISFRSK